MKRDEAISELRAARKELQETLQGLTEEDWTRPNAVIKWTLKDLIAHVASWDEEALRVLQAFSMQAEPQYAYKISTQNDFAAWNEEQVALRQNASLQQVLSEFENARRDLIQVVEGLTDPVLKRPKPTPWGSLISGFDLLSTQAEHDREHAVHVRSYRKKRERWARARQKYTSKRRDAKAK